MHERTNRASTRKTIPVRARRDFGLAEASPARVTGESLDILSPESYRRVGAVLDCFAVATHLAFFDSSAHLSAL